MVKINGAKIYSMIKGIDYLFFCFYSIAEERGKISWVDKFAYIQVASVIATNAVFLVLLPYRLITGHKLPGNYFIPLGFVVTLISLVFFYLHFLKDDKYQPIVEAHKAELAGKEQDLVKFYIYIAVSSILFLVTVQ